MAKDKKHLPRTVNQDLWEAWKRLWRKKDSDAMAEANGRSRVPYDNAFKYGYVVTAGISEEINGYFKERLDKEKDSAQALNILQDAIESKSNDTSPSN